MKPFFIKSKSGSIFLLYHAPKYPRKITGTILFVPPFAEELNRSRHMINRQARTFADAGYGVLVLDLYGTGDSEGVFGEATVALWQQDIIAALSWLSEISATPPILWAMRSGALIATDLIRQFPGIAGQLMLWSPVGSGKKFISQYLRIKLAADLSRKADGSQNTLRDLWARLDGGDNLEIAGYCLSSDLAHGLAALSLNNIRLPRGLSVKWVEISPAHPPGLSPASRKIIDAWQGDGVNISAVAVNGPPFWTLQEPEWAEAYIDQTLTIIRP